MCPECGLENVKILAWDEDGVEGAAFTCPDCGWQGEPECFEVPCTACGCKVRWSQIELDGECSIVCGECYLKNPPPEDIAGMYHDVQAEAVCAAGGVN